MFFFPFGTEPYHAIKLFAKRKQWRMDQISIDVKLAKNRYMVTYLGLSIFVLPGHLAKMRFCCGKIYFWVNISI